MVEEVLRVKVHRKTLEIGKTMVLFLIWYWMISSILTPYIAILLVLVVVILECIWMRCTLFLASFS